MRKEPKTELAGKNIFQAKVKKVKDSKVVFEFYKSGEIVIGVFYADPKLINTKKLFRKGQTREVFIKASYKDNLLLEVVPDDVKKFLKGKDPVGRYLKGQVVAIHGRTMTINFGNGITAVTYLQKHIRVKDKLVCKITQIKNYKLSVKIVRMLD